MTRLPRFSAAGQHVTVKIAVTGTVKATAFDDKLPPTGGLVKSRAVRLFNAGPDVAFIELVGSSGDQSVTLSDGVPIPAGWVGVLTTNGATAIAAISPTTATIYATPGEGI